MEVTHLVIYLFLFNHLQPLLSGYEIWGSFAVLEQYLGKEGSLLCQPVKTQDILFS